MPEQNRALTKYRQLLAVKEKELERHKCAIDRRYEMREEDNIDKSSFIERKKVRYEQIQALKKEIEGLRLAIQEQKDIPSLDKLRQ